MFAGQHCISPKQKDNTFKAVNFFFPHRFKLYSNGQTDLNHHCQTGITWPWTHFNFALFFRPYASRIKACPLLIIFNIMGFYCFGYTHLLLLGGRRGGAPKNKIFSTHNPFNSSSFPLPLSSLLPLQK